MPNVSDFYLDHVTGKAYFEMDDGSNFVNDLSKSPVVETVSDSRGGTTLSLPVYDSGQAVQAESVLMSKSGIGRSFSYSIEEDITLNAVFSNLASFKNTDTNWKELTKLNIPGDSLNTTDLSTISFSVSSNEVLDNCTIGILIGHRNSAVRSQAKYYTTKLLSVGQGTSATLQVNVQPIGPGIVKLSQVQAGTAPTAYPDASKNQVFQVNLLSEVCVRFFIKYATTSGTQSLQSATGTCFIKAPDRNLFDGSSVYNPAPFEDTDVWKSSLPSFTIAKPEISAANPASTGDQSTGTLNASGTSGSDILTVYSTTGVQVGMVPVIGNAVVVTPGVGPLSTTRPHLPDAVATLAAFGSDVTVIAIVNSTQVQLSSVLKGNVNLRGRVYYAGATDHVPCVAFYNSRETACIRMGQGSGTLGANPFTGVLKTATHATVARSSVPIFKVKKTDPVKTWRYTQVNAYNPWIFETSALNATIGFETFDNGTFKMKTPVFTQSWLTNNNQNPDRNLILITECGRYSIEMIGADVTNDVGTCTRVVVTDLTKKSTITPDIQDLYNVSYGTRAYGGPLTGGVIRKAEMDQCYSTGNIPADIDRAMNAIKHPIAMLISTGLGKSNNYCPDPAVQGTKVVYKSYRSCRSVHAPTIVSGGSGYAVGDTLTISGGTFTVPMTAVVQTVSSGVVTSVYVQKTGQYKTLPSDGANLATTSSSAGTGCVLNVLNLPNATDQTTLAIAFPDITTAAGVLQYPASVADNAFSTNYAGVVPMGAMFTLPQGVNLVTEWTTRRTNAPTAKSSSYELLAVLAAIQKYGAIVTDVSGSYHQIIVVDQEFSLSPNYSNLHGDTGGLSWPNLVEIKRLLTYVDNMSPLNRSSDYANIYPVLPAI